MHGFHFQHSANKEIPLSSQDVTDVIFLLPVFRIQNSPVRLPFTEISSSGESDHAPRYKKLVALLASTLAKED